MSTLARVQAIGLLAGLLLAVTASGCGDDDDDTGLITDDDDASCDTLSEKCLAGTWQTRFSTLLSGKRIEARLTLIFDEDGGVRQSRVQTDCGERPFVAASGTYEIDGSDVSLTWRTVRATAPVEVSDIDDETCEFEIVEGQMTIFGCSLASVAGAGSVLSFSDDDPEIPAVEAPNPNCNPGSDDDDDDDDDDNGDDDDDDNGDDDDDDNGDDDDVTDDDDDGIIGRSCQGYEACEIAPEDSDEEFYGCSGGKCALCTSNADCKNSLSQLACDTASGKCAQCWNDDDCATEFPGFVCKQSTHLCGPDTGDDDDDSSDDDDDATASPIPGGQAGFNQLNRTHWKGTPPAFVAPPGDSPEMYLQFTGGEAGVEGGYADAFVVTESGVLLGWTASRYYTSSPPNQGSLAWEAAEFSSNTARVATTAPLNCVDVKSSSSKITFKQCSPTASSGGLFDGSLELTKTSGVPGEALTSLDDVAGETLFAEARFSASSEFTVRFEMTLTAGGDETSGTFTRTVAILGGSGFKWLSFSGTWTLSGEGRLTLNHTSASNTAITGNDLELYPQVIFFDPVTIALATKAQADGKQGEQLIGSNANTLLPLATTCTLAQHKSGNLLFLHACTPQSERESFTIFERP